MELEFPWVIIKAHSLAVLPTDSDKIKVPKLLEKKRILEDSLYGLNEVRFKCIGVLHPRIPGGEELLQRLIPFDWMQQFLSFGVRGAEGGIKFEVICETQEGRGDVI
ncbi:unnamed protein product [Allacma fusca]|uniref:Uncharacterized protein n=1 Tax=Allacma fusca TaxID=39272 RepID=A0A8J2JRL3_9HEXA|nr:unnamed protein product [Allacma fusca]